MREEEKVEEEGLEGWWRRVDGVERDASPTISGGKH